MHLEIVFLVNSDQKTMLQESLNFLKVVELRDICQQFSIDENGVKNHLVTRIIHFLVTGQIIHEPIIPQISRAQRGYLYPLVPTTLILKGSYKNDLRTRLFFKQLIGDYFHFTAFGIDWVYER